MQNEKPPIQLFTADCPACRSSLMCGQTVKRGLHQCTKCKRSWVIEINESGVCIMVAPKDYRKTLAL